MGGSRGGGGVQVSIHKLIQKSNLRSGSQSAAPAGQKKDGRKHGASGSRALLTLLGSSQSTARSTHVPCHAETLLQRHGTSSCGRGSAPSAVQAVEDPCAGPACRATARTAAHSQPSAGKLGGPKLAQHEVEEQSQMSAGFSCRQSRSERNQMESCHNGREECPLCGLLIAANELDQHVQQELSELDAATDGAAALPTARRAVTQPDRTAGRAKRAMWAKPNPGRRQEQQSNLLVLGGKRSRGLSKRIIPSKPKAAAVDLFNHYSDGNGFWDGNQVGLEGARTAEDVTRWEGFGSVSMGPSLGPQ